MVKHANLMHNLDFIRRRFEVGPGDTGVIWLPPYHDMGLIGGILGALLLLALFDWVLILLSSIEGAHLITNGIVLPEKGSLILFIVLAVIGVIVQGSMLRGSRRTAD